MGNILQLNPEGISFKAVGLPDQSDTLFNKIGKRMRQSRPKNIIFETGVPSMEASVWEPQLHPVYFDNSKLNSFSDHFDFME